MNAFPSWLTDLPILGPLFHGSLPLVVIKVLFLVGACAVSYLLLRKFWGRGGDRLSEKRLLKEGDLEAAADLRARRNDLRGALELYERAQAWFKAGHTARRLGEHGQAAALYEEAGELKLALASYDAAGDDKALARLAEHTHDPSLLARAARWKKKSGRHEEAGELYRRAGMLRDAEQCYLHGNTSEGRQQVIDMYASAFQERRETGTVGRQTREYALRAIIHLAREEEFDRALDLCKQARLNPKKLETEAPGLTAALEQLRGRPKSANQRSPSRDEFSLESTLDSIGGGARGAGGGPSSRPPPPIEDDGFIDAPLDSPDALFGTFDDESPSQDAPPGAPADPPGQEHYLDAPLSSPNALIADLEERSEREPATTDHHSSVPPPERRRSSVPPPDEDLTLDAPVGSMDSLLDDFMPVEQFEVDGARARPEDEAPHRDGTTHPGGGSADDPESPADPSTDNSACDDKTGKVAIGKIALTIDPKRKRPETPREPGAPRRRMSEKVVVDDPEEYARMVNGEPRRDDSHFRRRDDGLAGDGSRGSRPSWDRDYAPPDVTEQMTSETYEPYSDADGEAEYLLDPCGSPIPSSLTEEDDDEPDVQITPSDETDLSVPIPKLDTREFDALEDESSHQEPAIADALRTGDEDGRDSTPAGDNVVEALLSVLDKKQDSDRPRDEALRKTPIADFYGASTPGPISVTSHEDEDEEGRDSFGFSSDVTNRYAILDRIGTGGMGEVFKARDLSLGRIVALKFLSPAMVGDETAMRFFLREAQAAAALNHPVIVTVFDIGVLDKRPFICMEFVDGIDLATRLADDGALPAGHALNLTIQLALALDFAHQRNVVHRDIKPPNVIETVDGVIKILDFGLAKAIQGSPKKSTLVAGTPEYMSPEQLAGLEVDGRTDIFSLGVLLYEVLTNHTPFEGALRSPEFEPASTHAPWLPHGIDDVLKGCLAIRPNDRFQTGRELAIALRKLLKGT